MLDGLLRRRADAERRFEEAERKIPAALLDGRDGELEHLREQRQDALRDADELADAIELAAERERRAAEAEADARRLRHAEAAAATAARRVEAAEAVDEALAALADAVAEYEAVGRELEVELRGAGRDDGNRVARNVAPFLRWACHRSALRCAELMGVPRAQAARRRPLVELERNLQRSLGL